MAFSFLVEILDKSTEKVFFKQIWPLVEPHLIQMRSKQTVDSFYFIMKVQEKFPTKLKTEQILGTSEIFCPQNFSQIYQVLWQIKSKSGANHPIYDILSKNISDSKYLEKFWLNEVDKDVTKNPNKIKEIITLKVLTGILLSTTNLKTATNLITKNFVALVLARFKTLKKNETDDLNDFYKDFFSTFADFIGKIEDNQEKIKLIEKLIIHPGSILFDRVTFSNTLSKLVENLNASGVNYLIKIYKEIVISKTVKDSTNKKNTWTIAERIHALQMISKLIGHKSVKDNIEWRTEQLKFLLNLSVFNTTDGQNLIPNKEKDILSKEIVNHVKNTFYRSLEWKFPKLQDEKNVLIILATHCNEILSKTTRTKFLRNSMKDETIQTWNNMFKEVSNKKNKENKLNNLFHILLLHMGIQLFNDPTVAQSAIEELDSCMKRVSKKRTAEKGEPEWIEVVIDLFLHLLSQNSSLLRKLITRVFTQLCPNLNLTSIHEILSVLDLKDGNNPLTTNDENDEESADEEEKSSEEEEKSDEDGDEKSEDSSSSESEDSSSSETDDEEEEEATVSDKLRSALTTALGSAAGIDSDQESLDLDDMDDEQANKLDEALSIAFEQFTENRKKNKVTKKDRVDQTTLLHFRIRVLDLVEIYLKNSPKMSFTLEIIVSLFGMLEHCVKDKNSAQLLIKVQNVLNKLTSIRHFDDFSDVTETNLIETLRQLILEKISTAAQRERNLNLSKIGVFIISCSQNIKKSSKIIEFYKEYLKEYIELRNPVLTLSFFTNIFNYSWSGLWDLVQFTLKNGLKSETRSFRRTQLVGLITLIYKNHRFLNLNLDETKLKMKNIEKDFNNYLAIQSNSNNLSTREFTEITNLLIEIHRYHMKNPSTKSILNWKEIGVNVQKLRAKIFLESNQNVYKNLCNLLKIEAVKNAEDLVKKTKSDENDEEESNEQEKVAEKQLKRKNGAVDHKKEKRLKKESRLKTSSEGLINGGFTFANNGNDEIIDKADADEHMDVDSDSDSEIASDSDEASEPEADSDEASDSDDE